MSNMSDLKCTSCATALERVRYFPRQLLTADDLGAEQEYQREKSRRHQRYLHGWGVVCGCEVERFGGADSWQVNVKPGYAVSPSGDEVCIADAVRVDLRLGVQDAACTVRTACPPWGEPPAVQEGTSTAYVAVRYAECHSRPVRVHPAGCGCDDADCEYSRVRESFEIKVLWSLPESHTALKKDQQAWRQTLEEFVRGDSNQPLPIPPCPACSFDPWVVLATVTVSPTKGDVTERLRISYKDRPVLWSTQRLQAALLVLAK
ncbi:hypothetical protein [Variovorax sp. YR752]|uniref:hypothetical protein n=1 Tax=Variovorax sp. YR752 TaxID=1884383 RepID=UPI003137E813